MLGFGDLVLLLLFPENEEEGSNLTPRAAGAGLGKEGFSTTLVLLFVDEEGEGPKFFLLDLGEGVRELLLDGIVFRKKKKGDI